MLGLLIVIIASWSTNRLFVPYRDIVHDVAYTNLSEGEDNDLTAEKVMIMSLHHKISQTTKSLNIIFVILCFIILFFLYCTIKSAKEAKSYDKNINLLKSKIRNIINVTNVATWEWNYETNEVVINENYAEMCGYTLSELTPMTYDRWEKMIYPSDLDRIRNLTQNYITGILPLLDYECRVLNKSGEIMWFHVRARTISRGENGRPVWIYGVDSDITFTKHAQDINNQYQKLETVGVLAGGIAHEFNNIMTGAYGYIELALPRINEDKAIKYLQSSIAALDRAKLISSKLLTFSEGGKIIITSQQIEYFLRNTIISIVTDRSYSISFHSLTDLWSVFYDKNQIYNVIMNILYNAMESMPEGGHIKIITLNTTVKNHSILKPGKYIRVSITDHGGGILPEHISRLFDPFFTTKDKHQGLGLTLAFSIVKRHNGCIDVHSDEHGSEFSIFLPADYPVSNNESFVSDASTNISSGNILILEDDDTDRDVLIQILSVLGYNVYISYTFEQVIKLLLQNKYILTAIFVNLSTLKRDLRPDIAKTIKAQADFIPVYITSSKHEDPIMLDPAEYHFTDCIKKPFTIFDIEEKLSKLSKYEK